jgi:hypothetical protein
MMKPAFFLSFIILGVIAFVLFEVEYRVDSLRSQFNEVNRELVADRQEIHVLRAEWSYLNQPERLKKLSQKYLALETARPRQIRDIGAIPFRDQNLAAR